MNTIPPPKVAVLTNMVSPARIPLLSGLAQNFDLLILHGGSESNRVSWNCLDEPVPSARTIKAWGWQIRIPRRINGSTFDHRYLHVTPGYVWHLLRFRPSAVVSNEMGLRTLMALAYGALFRKPVWVWWGGTLHTERALGHAKRLVRGIISRWAKKWISYGRSSTEYLVSLGIKPKNVLEIQNAVDERRFFDSTDAAPQCSHRPVLLHVGQFTRRKGVDLLLRTAATLQQEGANFSLVLVGDGPEKPAMEQLARELGLTSVQFEPSRPPELMPAVYRNADILVFPTLEDVWGLVANEAVWCGLPVVCSKYAGCAEELFDAECIFNPENAAQFVDQLRKAVRGEVPRADRARLRSTPELVASLVRAIKAAIPDNTCKPLETRPEQVTPAPQLRPAGRPE